MQVQSIVVLRQENIISQTLLIFYIMIEMLKCAQYQMQFTAKHNKAKRSNTTDLEICILQINVKMFRNLKMFYALLHILHWMCFVSNRP